MTMRGKVILAAVLAASSALGACASASSDAPAWFAQEAGAPSEGYPSLHDVPTTTTANTNAAHWATVQQEVLAAGAAMRASPRATPAGPTDPADFIADAQSDLEEARQAHEP